MFVIYSAILFLAGPSWGADDHSDYRSHSQIRQTPGISSSVRRQIAQILDEEDGSQEEEEEKELSPLVHRSNPVGIQGRGNSLEEHSFGVSPSMSKLLSDNTRLATQIREDSDGDSSEDEYEAYIEREVIPHVQKEYALAHPGNLYSYIAKELHINKGISEEEFRNYRVSVNDILSMIELNIGDSVLNISIFLRDKKDLKAREFEEGATALVKGRRAGIDLLGQGSQTDFVINCKALIFKFYAKELFSRLIMENCDGKAYLKFLESVKDGYLTSLLDKKLSHEVSFLDLDKWLNVQEKTMILLEAFTTDLCGVKYGGINDVKRRLEEVAIPFLKSYLEINLIFLTTWYEENRNGLSKALSVLGAKTSQTKVKFDEFVDKFKSRFCSSKFSGHQITLDKDEVNQIIDLYKPKFEQSDQQFTQSISGTITKASSWLSPSGWGW